MSISVTDLGTASNTTGTTLALTVPAGGVPAGATIIVCVCEAAGSTGGGVADSAGNTYTGTTPRTNNNSSSNGYGWTLYSYNVAALVSGNSITLTKFGSDAAVISVIYVTGLQTATNPFDSAVEASATGTGSSPSVTSNAPAQAGELFIGVVSAHGTITFSQDTGHGWASPPTAISIGGGTSAATAAGGNQINAGSGALTFAPSFGGSNRAWAAFVFGFKPGGGSTNKTITITSAQTVSLKRPPGKYFGIVSPSTVLMKRAMARAISVVSPSLVGLRKGMARSVVMTQAQVVSLFKGGTKSFAMTSGQTVSLIARLAYRVTPSIVSAQLVTTRFQVGKVLAVLSGQSVNMRRAMARSIAVTQDQSVALLKTVKKPLAIVQAQTVSLSRSGNKRIAITSAQVLNVRKSVGKFIRVLSAQTVSLFPRYAKRVLMTMSMGQNVMLATMPIVFAAPKQMLKNVIRRLFILR